MKAVWSRICAKKLANCRNYSAQHKKYDIKRLSADHSPVKLSYAMFGHSQNDEYCIEKSSFMPPLVIVHGLFGHRANWQSLAKAMARKLDTKIYVPELRNHGSSPRTSSMTYLEMAADLEEMIETEVLDTDFFTGFSKMALIGHSMGGNVATVLALSRPDLIDTLIIEDVTPKSYAGRNSMNTFPKYIEAMLSMEGDFSDFSSVFAARKFADFKMKDAVPDEQTRQFLLTNLFEKDGVVQWKANLKSIRDNMDSIVGFPEFTDAHNYSGPTLVVSGGLSSYVKEEDKAIFRGYFPYVEFRSIDDAGHWVHSDKPKEFMEVVQDKLIMA